MIAPAAPPAPPVRATLFPYQLDGLAWLRWLDDTGPGGVLADEMGLGKTLQVIALLATLHQTRPGVRAIVLTTTSTVHNWCAEIAKFAPQLRVAAWTGQDRHRSRGVVFAVTRGRPAFHVVVMSYDTARVDAAFLATVPPFDWCILDEAQRIKNADSSIHRVARTIPTRRRLVITGTPIENGVEDFYALVSWAVPGLLGPRVWFMETYEIALRDGDAQAAATIQRVTQPFVLRRKKADVGLRLPPKTSTMERVVLPPVQRDIYNRVHEAARSALRKHQGKGGRAERVAMFEIILRLRQVACDPRLFGIPYLASAKLRALVAILAEAKRDGKKVLVFSSFAQMIRLLERDLTKLGYGVVVLDGSVPQQERAALTTRFERDPHATVFLITLKAGGAGLNLTAASVVVHFDPWWNPAAEDQATARAHRIGQTRDVRVVRLLAADTIEDSVVETIGAKRELAGLLLGESAGESVPASVFAHELEVLRALILKTG